MDNRFPVLYDHYPHEWERMLEYQMELNSWARRAYFSYWLKRLQLCMPDEVEQLIPLIRHILHLAGEQPEQHLHAVYVDEAGQLVRSWLMSREAFHLLISRLPVQNPRAARVVLHWIRYA
ncbi:MAG: hypothetical protein IRZ01_02505 [Thermoflavifilum aggregans]|nr:hypothetical protein [Thermoflavifilum aggregans]